MIRKGSRKVISLNILYAIKEKNYILLTFQNNLNCEKQVILLMIPNGKVWHYIALKKLLTLRGIVSKHDSCFY